ncbi:ComF family protein [Breoghania sp.]|uniref:ComF family protein n=1 Tax=Breoghania sp. TaxID=2065378 RepID=UPI0026077B2D|nr:ComF family protein [Breoghania sp.]MDJ0932549.1 ComF family protein [Breoghania sp.]
MNDPIAWFSVCPLAYDLGEVGLSAEAIADPPPLERARAACIHDDISRGLVHGLKYRDRLGLAPAMAGWMARAGAELVAEADIIVPVPLHRRRLWSRRFNQAAVLAGSIARQCNKSMDPAVLARIRATPRQVGLHRDPRRDNVRGAFVVDREQRAMIEGRRVLLIDDVIRPESRSRRARVRSNARARCRSTFLTFARVVSPAAATI